MGTDWTRHSRRIAIALLTAAGFLVAPCVLRAGQPPWKSETWPKTRTLIWAKPGTGGSFGEAANWLENGKPSTSPPDQDTDIVLPAAGKFYKVGGASGKEARHVTIEKNAMLVGGHRHETEIWGNCHVKEGGRAYFISFRGPRHTFFRMDGAEFPNPKNRIRYGHVSAGASDPKNRTQISHKLQVCKYGDASVEFIGNFGVSDEIMVQHGRLILSGELRWSGQTNKGALEVYDGGVLELQSGAVAGPFISRNGKGVYNMDVYRNGVIQAGSPERPLTSDAHLLLGFDNNSSAGRTGLYAAAGSQIRVYSADPATARLVVSSITSVADRFNGSGGRVGKPDETAKGKVGVTLQLAGDVALDGVHFDYICEKGIGLAEDIDRTKWKNVTFGPHCAGPEDKLFGNLRENPNVYYHKRGDGKSEFGLTVKAVRSMEDYMKKADPYRIAVSPSPTELKKGRGNDPDRPASVVFAKPIQVKISCAVTGAELHYTLDGSEPTENSSLYAGPITLSETTRLRVKAFRDGKEPSATFSAAYVFK